MAVNAEPKARRHLAAMLGIALGLGMLACEPQLVSPGSPLADVRITPRPAAVELHSRLQLEVRLLDADGNQVTDARVFWASEDTTIARVSETGEVTGRGRGTTRIAASSQGVSGTTAVTVLPKSVARVVVTPAQAEIVVGQVLSLAATARDRSDAVLADRSVSWSSADTAVARVDGKGTVVGVRPGTTAITASAEGQSASSSVVVTRAPIATLAVAPTSIQLNPGGTRQLAATARDAGGSLLTGRTIAWSSSATEVARVDANGLVTAVAPGQATITATSEGRSASSAVTIVPVPVAAVEVTPSSADLAVGDTRQLTATPRGADGQALSGRTVTWSSSAPAVAQVNATGLVTARVAGQATITASSEGRTGSATIRVMPVPVASLTMSPTSAELRPDQTRQLTATPRAADGQTLQDRTIVWSSSAPAVARVSGTGLVTGLSEGRATITASTEGRSATAAITVLPAPVPDRLLIVSGNQQTGVNNRSLPAPLVVRVLDAQGRPLTGIEVSWTTSSGTITRLSSTDSAGEAEATWTLGGGGPGERHAWAEVLGLLKIEFVARRQ
jgi:trimeric autotransporter adhesin